MSRETISFALKRALADNRLQKTHISLYIAVLTIWEENNFNIEFFSSRKKIMTLSKIRSYSTYHDKIRDLVNWGYIVYLASYHPRNGSEIRVVSNRKKEKEDK